MSLKTQSGDSALGPIWAKFAHRDKSICFLALMLVHLEFLVLTSHKGKDFTHLSLLEMEAKDKPKRLDSLHLSWTARHRIQEVV